MEKSVRIATFQEKEEMDFEYWLQADPKEKLDTLQALRAMVYDLKHEDRKGFQRILKVVEQEKG